MATLWNLVHTLITNGTIDDEKSLVSIDLTETDENGLFDGCIKDAVNAHIFSMYGSRNVVSWERRTDSIRIIIEGGRYKDDQMTTLWNLMQTLITNGTFVDEKDLVAVCLTDLDENDILFDGCLKDAGNAHIFTKYGSRNVVSWEKLPNSVRIVIEGGRYKDDQKFYFDIYDEGARGRVILTFAEALAVAYAVNQENWIDYKYHDDESRGRLLFWLESAEPVED